MPEAVRRVPARRRAVWAALLQKEWCEQRWRFFLGTVVVSGLLAGLLRAQIVPSLEAVALIYGAVGLVLVIFFAAGPVAAERADRTWEFLMVQPVSRSEVILAKWAMGVLQLTGTMAIATVAGILAMWSRGFRIMPNVSGLYARNSAEAFGAWSSTHPALSLCVFAAVATTAMACWFTPLYLLLARARNEFAAALGGVLLTIALLLWLTLVTSQEARGVVTALSWVIIAALNPLLPFVALFVPAGPIWLPLALAVLALAVDVTVWIVFPLWYVGRSSSGLIEKWVGA
jgi:ABC-type transport system involved in multi-copper enzyme maturation permease subunit